MKPNIALKHLLLIISLNGLFSTNLAAAEMAIIIDDLGPNWTQAKKILALPKQVTTSILPFTPHAKTIAKRAALQGRVTMLHVPMEADDRNELLGPGALRSAMNGWQLVAQLRKDIVSLPSITGVNNHMGSELTTEKATMKWVMALLWWHGLYFIDSRTTPNTVALSVANSMGVSSGSRDVFLDHDISKAAIEQQFQRAKAIAHKTGFAIIIGHPYDETIAVLQQQIPLLKADGINLVSPQEIIKGRARLQNTKTPPVFSISSLFE